MSRRSRRIWWQSVEILGLGATEIAIALVALAVGACVQSSLGFGLGLLVAPILVLLDPRLVPGPLLAMGLPLTILIARRDRVAMDVKGVRWAIVGRIPGAALGGIAIVLLAPRGLSALFVGVILTAVVLSVLGLSVTPTSSTLFGAGVLSGFMATSVGVGGPPLALVYQRSDGPEIRASLAGIQIFGSVTSVAALTVVGKFDSADLRLAGLLVSGLLVGFGLSFFVAPHLDRRIIRPAVLVFATVSAVSIVIRDVI